MDALDALVDRVLALGAVGGLAQQADIVGQELETGGALVTVFERIEVEACEASVANYWTEGSAAS